MIRSVLFSGAALVAIAGVAVSDAPFAMAQSSDDATLTKEELKAKEKEGEALIAALFSDESKAEREAAGLGPAQVKGTRPLDNDAFVATPKASAPKAKRPSPVKQTSDPSRVVKRTIANRRPVSSSRRSDPCYSGTPKVARPATLSNALQFNVTFETNSAGLQPDSFSDITTLAAGLSSPKFAGKKFLIEGHSDCVGNANYNRELSQRRADAVKAALIDAGVSADQLVAIGFGEERRLAGEKPNSRALRRVELTPIALEAE